MVARPAKRSRSTTKEPSPDDNASIIKTTATLAWATSAFAFSVGAMRWVTPEGAPIDAVLGLVIGGGAAYLALALGRVPQAVADCQRIAFVAGVANGVMLPLAIAACFNGLPAGWPETWPQALSLAGTLAVGIGIAVCGAATPWIAYWTLRARRVREWFAAAGTAAPVGMWMHGR